MKKNISINIGGIIFHIEEDGFDKLRAYLDSVNQYFSTFEDSKEIIDDIENRIAEIFLSKLSDGKQVISNEDVVELMSTMGTTQDFDATIETESEGQTQNEAGQQQERTTHQEEESEYSKDSGTGSRKLYRDERRKVLGGVAAGIAHYFGIDPIWIRLLFIALFVNVFFGGLSGAVAITYLILWIVVPGNRKLDDDDQNVKKLFRDGESRALGGVCSGLASYFGTDTTVVRLLFVLSIFLGGAGIIVYIILWIITPEARTITEKMQMEGEPVTLSNIEENVKKNLNEDEGEESALAKVLLFPFRVIATVIKAISSALGPVAAALVEIVRIFFGLIITVVGFSIMISLIIAFLVVLGWDSGYWADYVYFGHIPTEIFARSVNIWSVLSAFLIAFIPALCITLLGLYVLLKRSVVKAYVVWALFGFWILGLIGSAIFIPSLARDFRTDSTTRTQRTFAQTGGTPTLRLNDIDLGSYEAVDLRLRGHSDSVYRLEVRTTARGANRNDARDNASAISYHVSQSGDDFYFDSNISFDDDAAFRFQEVDATFYIPEGKVFRMDRDLAEILTNTLYLNGYRTYQMEDNDWMFNEGGLECITCATRRGSRRSSSRSRVDSDSRDYSSVGSDRDWRRIRGEEVSFQYDDFEEVKVSSHFKVFVVEGDEYEVRLRGDEDDLERVSIRNRSNTLEIKRRNRDWGWWEKGDWPNEIGIYIVMPKLEALELSGACDGEIRGFEDYDMEITLQGASELEARIRPDYLEIDLNGASKLELDGSAEKIDARVTGASKLDAVDFRSETGEISLNGASKASVFVTDELWVDANGISTVSYKGDPKLYAEKNGLSTVKRY